MDQLTLSFDCSAHRDELGRVVLTPRAPKVECGPKEAARILGCDVRSLANVVNYYDPHELIQWRWLGFEGSGGKRLFISQSLHDYRRWKGASRTERPEILQQILESRA